MIDEFGILRPDPMHIDTVIKEHVPAFIENGKLLEENGLVVGTGGNLSMRVPGGILITSTQSLISDLKSDEIVFVFAADREHVYYVGSKKPSSETITHWVIYQERPDVQAISHVNTGPKDSKDITISKEEIAYGTIDLGYDTAAYLKKVDVVMMRNHGMMIVGQSLSEATKLTIETADREKPYIFVSGQQNNS